MGQFTTEPIGHLPEKSQKNTSAKKLAEGDTLALPFWDDFSFSSKTPDTLLWNKGEDVFVNPSIGIKPPSLNVATFDGIDGQGIPHDSTMTDVLESKVIDLGGLSEIDRVVFSFYWQMTGHGNPPGKADNLSLIFYDDQLQEETVWTKNGADSLLIVGIDTLARANQTFLHERIVLEEKYLHKGFYFRFESKGSTEGPFDQWHIDYVYLNRDRSLENQPESLNDHAIGDQPTSIFTPYTTIPRSQLFAYGDSIFTDIYFTLTNFNDNKKNATKDYHLIQVDSIVDGIRYGAVPLHSELLKVTTTLDGLQDQQPDTIAAMKSSYFNNTEDAMTIISEVIYNTGNQYFILSDDGNGNVEYLIDEEYNYRLNDTSRFVFEIDEVLAYDDGTAENSAGIKSETAGAQIAVYYNLATSDTLTHVDINFPTINGLPDNSRFKLSITKNLSGDENSILTSQEYSANPSASSIDQFTSFEFDKPAILNGRFYVIFEQFTGNRFPIGLDLNTKNGNKIYLNYGSEWEPNNILDVNGSLMIRPRFADSDYVVTSIENQVNDESLNIYPNPAHDQLHIKGEFLSYELYNLSGQKVLKGTSADLSLISINEGIYILKIHSGTSYSSHKIVIRH